jgi:hypothetical protein
MKQTKTQTKQNKTKQNKTKQNKTTKNFETFTETFPFIRQMNFVWKTSEISS